jgi:acyl-CoA reductase-like NAD-dependent aldehyde dehydrogenase
MANEAPTQFYSRDIGRIWRVAEALECAIVGINEGVTSTEVAPFGGMKEKGIGREGLKYALTHRFRARPQADQSRHVRRGRGTGRTPEA